MSDIKAKLNRIRERFSDPAFLANKGLSNEVGIHVFCYDPADELIVREFTARLKSESGTPYHIRECDLYEIFLRLLEDRRVLKSVAGLEEKRGSDYLLRQLQKLATPETLLEYMKYEPHEPGRYSPADRRRQDLSLSALAHDARQHAALFRGYSHRDVLSRLVQRAGSRSVRPLSRWSLLPRIQSALTGG